MQISKRSEIKILVVILTVSIFTRLAASLYLGNEVEMLPGIADQVTYHTLAQRVVDGYGFTFDRPWWPATPAGEATAHWSYLYTFFLALVYKLFSVNPLIARVLQATLVGFLQPLLLYQISKTLFPNTSALFAAGWIAVYPYLIFYSAALMTEAMFITLVLAVIQAAIRAYPAQLTVQRSLAIGLLCALAVLLRQVLLLFIPFLFLWLLWVNRKHGFWLPLRNLAISGLVILAFILPFTIYNFQRFDRFVLLNTNAGFAFFWANNPIYGTRFEGILPEEMGNYLEMLPLELKGLNEAALDSELLRRGLAFVADHPAQYLLLSLSRFPVLLEFWPKPESSVISNITRVTSFGFALPFMLYGIWLSIKGLIRARTAFFDSPLSLVLGFGVIYGAIHILTWSLVRYRLPIDALFLAFAGLALATITKPFFAKYMARQGNKGNPAIEQEISG